MRMFGTFPQRLTNKQHVFTNQLNLAITKRPFHFFIIIMKVTFASTSLSTVKGRNAAQQFICFSFIEIRHYFSIMPPSKKD